MQPPFVIPHYYIGSYCSTTPTLCQLLNINLILPFNTARGMLADVAKLRLVGFR